MIFCSGKNIEKTAGWIRIGLIYYVGGTCAQVVRAQTAANFGFV